MDLISDLQARGLVHDHTDLEALQARLARGPIGVYVGFDPTADRSNGYVARIMRNPPRLRPSPVVGAKETITPMRFRREPSSKLFPAPLKSWLG